MKVLRTYRLANFGSGLIDETAELKLVAQVPLIKHSELDLDDGTNPHGTTKADVGLGNVDNTSDADKPISTATATALSGKQNNLGFTPESVANKNNTTLNNSSTEYPTSGLVLKERAPIVVSSNTTAILNRVHNVVANATLTDPTPVEGMGYAVNVINGIATVGGVAYSVGSELYRHYHSGSWRTFEYVNGKELERFFYSDGDGVLGTPHTGDTLEAVLLPIPITAGYYQVKDWMNALFSINKPTTSTNNVTYRMRVGTTGTTADNLLATFVTNQRSFAFSRYNMQFLTGNIIRAINSLAGAQTDLINASAISNVSVNPSSAFYLTLTAQLTDSTEQVQCIGARVSRIKPSN